MRAWRGQRGCEYCEAKKRRCDEDERFDVSAPVDVAPVGYSKRERVILFLIWK
jgi:hypothetical protein